VLLLPYLEGDALQPTVPSRRAWTSEHNKKLHNEDAGCVSESGQHGVRSGENQLPNRPRQGHGFFREDGATYASITDGASTTITTVEVSDAKAVIWTKPDRFRVRTRDPLKGLVGPTGRWLLSPDLPTGRCGSSRRRSVDDGQGDVHTGRRRVIDFKPK